MRPRSLTVMLAALMLLIVTAAPALADGIIIPDPQPPIDKPPIGPGFPVVPTQVIPYLTVKYHRVEVTIDNQKATTRIDQVFINEYDRDIEGTYMFPLPEDAAISTFDMWVDGKRLEGRILPKAEARRIYEEIVRGRRDPALLEYVGRNTFQARIFPIPARSEKRVQLEYTQLLTADNGLVKYVYPLSTERFSTKPLGEVMVSVKIKSQQAIKSVYSSSHDVAISRNGDREAAVSYEGKNVKPDKDMVVYYSTSSDDVGMSLLTYRPAGEDGYFVLLAAPRVEVVASKVAPKDVIMVVDNSGSMDGAKITQAKDALKFILDHLNADDRFNIIVFNTAVTRYADGPRPASERQAARRFVDDIRAAGGTNIDGALQEALSAVGGANTSVVIFLTDGLPTAGQTDINKIAQNAKAKASAQVRLFPFGVGYDVNTVLLDTLASQNRGASAYVKPGENLEDAVSGFYTKVGQPLLTDLRLDFGSARAYDVYPSPAPDLFAGSQLVMSGRFKGDGPTSIVLTGKDGEGERRFVYAAEFPRGALNDADIARLWATRKVGYLLTQVRLNGPDKELVNEIVALATRFGIVTPYTSFLVDERQNLAAPGAAKSAGEALYSAMATPAAAAGPQAVQNSQSLDALRSGAQSAGQAPGQVKQVGDKAFVSRQGAWIDTTYSESMNLIALDFGSDAYFALVSAHPEWARYLAVGDRLIVVLGGAAYRVGDVAAQGVGSAVTPTPQARVTPGPAGTQVVRPNVTPTPTRPTVSTPGGWPTPTPAPSTNPLEQFWSWLLSLFGGS